MADNDLSAEFKAVGEAVANLARKAEALAEPEVRSILEKVKSKLNELQKVMDDELARHKAK